LRTIALDAERTLSMQRWRFGSRRGIGVLPPAPDVDTPGSQVTPGRMTSNIDILPSVNAEDSSNSWEWIAQDHSLHGWGFLFSLGCLAALKPVRDACNLQGSFDSGVAPPESGDGHHSVCGRVLSLSENIQNVCDEFKGNKMLWLLRSQPLLSPPSNGGALRGLW
jgi:hypothetical protein